jgi:hypothetical protein
MMEPGSHEMAPGKFSPKKTFLVSILPKSSDNLPVKWSNPMKREKYHELAGELLVAVLDKIGGEEHTNSEIFSEFGKFSDIFESLVNEIHDDRLWPDRPPIQIGAEIHYLEPRLA